MFTFDGQLIRTRAAGPLKLTDTEHFTSHRADGRHTATFPALLEMMRERSTDLEMPKELTPESFAKWQKNIKERALLLLNLPKITPQPDPVMLSSEQRDGYRLEKWEYYPDDWTVVPFYALIPDGADAEHPVPGVMCMLGSNYSKEMAAGEPLLAHPNCRENSFLDRNCMAKHIAKGGMAAFAFDNPGVAETALNTDPSIGMSDFYTRIVLCNHLMNNGLGYMALTVFHRLQFMDQFLLKQSYIDKERIGISSFSLGTEGAMFLGMLRDEIKAIVHNECLHDDRLRFVSITEHPDDTIYQNYGNWHTLPGHFASFSFPDLCAAFAPRHLALTEGGAYPFLEKVKRAYKLVEASDNLSISYYPQYADPQNRVTDTDYPLRGIDAYECMRYLTCGDDHSFRKEPALRALWQAFGMDVKN